MNKYRKLLYVIQKGGLKAIVRKIVQGSSGVKLPTNEACKIDILRHYDFLLQRYSVKYVQKKDRRKLVNWFLNDMGPSGGGDINIFRFVNQFAKHGYRNNVYITYGSRFKTNQELTKFIYENFGSVKAKFHISTAKIEKSNYCFATEWRTAYFVNQLKNQGKKLYFVQDFEPHFFSHGSEYYLAENTYKMGLVGITAGVWLEKKLRKEYGMLTKGYKFASNPKIFYEDKRICRSKNRVFFYARPATLRRCFELGLMALDNIYKKKKNIEIVLAGWDLSAWDIPFPHVDLSVMPLDKLNEELNKSNVGLILSATNASLMPADLMLTGCIPVVNAGENNTWLIKDNINGLVVENDPEQIAVSILELLKDSSLQEKLRKGGKDYAAQIGMDDQFKGVSDFINSI